MNLERVLGIGGEGIVLSHKIDTKANHYRARRNWFGWPKAGWIEKKGKDVALKFVKFAKEDEKEDERGWYGGINGNGKWVTSHYFMRSKKLGDFMAATWISGGYSRPYINFRISKVNRKYYYIKVMERYQQSLWKYLESTNFSLEERLKMAIKLTKELRMAHDGGVVHRDLKPTNIMIDAKNRLTLVDFGIGKESFDLQGSCGTPGFNAPEQFSGEKQNEPVDIFSLGKNLILILFEWKIGLNLLWSSKEWIKSQSFEQKLAPLFNLFGIIHRMMQIKPKKRPKLKDVLKNLESTAALISKDPKSKAEWKSFHSLIKVPAEFKVDEKTQCSRDVFNEISQLTLKAKSGQMVTEGTK